jgi:hypothetical protein
MSEEEQVIPAYPYYIGHSTRDSILLYYMRFITCPWNNFSPQHCNCGRLFDQPYHKEIDVYQSEIIPSGAGTEYA